MKTKLFLIISISIFVIFCVPIAIMGAVEFMKINKKKVIEIANQEVIKLGYDIDSLKVKINKFDTSWNDYLRKEDNSTYAIEKKNKLLDKIYWAVYYSPKELLLGGDVCVFIDSQTGEILAIIRGK